MTTQHLAVAEDAILLTVKNGVAYVTLNRPERLNALAGDMRDSLYRAIDRAAISPEVRVIVVTGTGRGFCTGADVEVMSALLARGADAEFAHLVEAGARVVRRLREVEQPVIAALNGPAAGAGAALALACDFRWASSEAQIGFTFNRIGLHPDWGTTYFLPRLVGPGRAAELVMSGRMVGADEAYRLGIFDRVIDDIAFDGQVESLAEVLAAKPPLAIRLAKRTLQHSPTASLDDVLEMEREAQLRCFRTADAREGISAFREKRHPVFRGE